MRGAKMKRFVAVAAAGIALAGVITTPSGATMPGRNGKIAFWGIDDNGDDGIFLLDPTTGTVEGRIDPPSLGIETDYGWTWHSSTRASFSPDGTRLAWARYSAACLFPPSLPGGCAAGQSIWVMNADGSNPMPVTQLENQVWEWSPSWSPDGHTIVFSRGRPWECSDLFTVTESSSGQWSERIPLSTQKGCEDEAEFSPDGKRILFAYDVAATGRETDYDWKKYHYQLFLMNADGSGRPKRVTRTRQNTLWSTFAPDGRWIGFELSDNKQGVGHGIYIIRIDGSGKKRITFGLDALPSWSPDGTEIAFERGGIESNEDLHAVSVKPPYRVRLLLGTPDWEGEPDWQPLPKSDASP